MKILIKQTDWSGWNGGSSLDKNFEYDVKLKKEIIVKSTEYTTAKKSLFKRNTYVEVDFSFKVLEIGEDYLKLQTNGSAGGEYNIDKKKYLHKTCIIKLGETLTFSTKTMDAGSSFEITLVNN